jgi:hypothetical protein
MEADVNTFSCTARADINHNNILIDIRIIDEQGEIFIERDDLDSPFEPNTTYYWKIVARDNYYDTSASPVWHFTTAAE